MSNKIFLRDISEEAKATMAESLRERSGEKFKDEFSTAVPKKIFVTII